MDAAQDYKQHFATPSFRELHKVQRQVLQPASAYVADQSTSVIGATTSQETKVTQEGAYDDGLQARHSFSAGSQAQSRNKTQVFLPGEKACVYKREKAQKKYVGMIMMYLRFCIMQVRKCTSQKKQNDTHCVIAMTFD